MKKLISLALVALMVFSLCACGASAKSQVAEPAAAEAPAAMYMTEAAEYSYDMAAAEEMGGLAATGSRGEMSDALPEVDPDKIIYSADANVETTNFDESLELLDQMVQQYGGWVESSSINGANYYSQSRGHAALRSASYSLRIPSQHFTTLMNSLSQIGNIPYTHTYTENVTTQYYDSQARLTAYRTQEESLLNMMEKAETVSDLIAIEEKLTELRYQIESIQSTLNNWDRQVSYSSVYVNIEEVREYTPEAEQSYLEQLWQALTGALKDMGQFFKDALVFLVSALPTLIVLAVLVLILRPVVKKAVKRRRDKRSGAEKKEAEDK